LVLKSSLWPCSADRGAAHCDLESSKSLKI
jgi:hypothetical protein